MSAEIMRVVYTPDGDTVRCLRTTPQGTATAERRVRLAWIDAPEMSQAPYGLNARAYLRRLLALGERVKVTILGQDLYGRLLGEMLRVRDDGNCGLRLVLGGYCALHECPQSRSEYYAAQEIAQRKKIGIWHTPGLQQTPWLYREQQGPAG